MKFEFFYRILLKKLNVIIFVESKINYKKNFVIEHLYVQKRTIYSRDFVEY